MAGIINTCHTEWLCMIRMTETRQHYLAVLTGKESQRKNKVSLGPDSSHHIFWAAVEVASVGVHLVNSPLIPAVTREKTPKTIQSWVSSTINTPKLYLKQPLVMKIFFPRHNLKKWNSHTFAKKSSCALFIRFDLF